MQKSLSEIKLSEIMVEVLREDKKINALSKALDSEIKKVSAEIKKVLHLPRLEELPDEVLDHLAWQYHVDDYSISYPAEIKRNMIRQSIYLHRIKGTRYGLELALSAFSRAEIAEWFEYSGKPYYFKLKFRQLHELGDDGEDLLKVILENKNLRSWLEEINFDFTDEQNDSQNLKHAMIDIMGGEEIFTDCKNDFQIEKNIIRHAIGEEITDFLLSDIKINFPAPKIKINATIGEILCEYFFSDCEKTLSDEKIFSAYLAWHRKKYNENPIIKIYANPQKDPLSDDNIIYDQDYLRLYFAFPDYSYRTLTLPNPRNDLSGDLIVSLSVYSKDNETILNSRGSPTVGISRAVIRKKTVHEII